MATTKKALVFGSGGQLGFEVTRLLSRDGWNAVGFDRQTADVRQADVVSGFIESEQPELVVNCAAYNLVDRAETEPAAAFLANALAVRNLALGCAKTGARLVHFSTDYVFDGTGRQPYSEEDRPHPINAYGVSKLSGEFYAFAYLKDALVIRTCGVFGPEGIHTAHGNFVETMLRNAHAGRPLRVVSDTIASPTFAPALAEKAVALASAGASGLYHVGGGEPISWFDFATLIFDVSQIEASLEATTREEYPTAAARPHFSALSNAKLEADGFGKVPTLREAMLEYFDRRETVLRKGNLSR
ncbi:MAG: dTDP-4-dehydrorhamnose reductase [Bryobacterales bacterium]|nr:dTDP-4-dehydrorhamnose reductase [Bryobacterales bacterium]